MANDNTQNQQKEESPPHGASAPVDNKNKQGGVVYQQDKNAQKEAMENVGAVPVDIPEEFLSDDDLYPAVEQGSSGNILSLLQKKRPLFIIGAGAVVLILFLIIVISRLLGGNGSSAANQAVKLTYWGLWEPEAVMNELIAEYTKEHPNVEIEYSLRDVRDQYRERLIERTKRGTGPDIFRFHNTWTLELREILAPAPQTVLTTDEFRTTFYPVIYKDLVMDQSIVGVPFGIDGLVLLSNSTILKGAGFSTPPQTWEEILEVARATTVRSGEGEIITAGIALGSAESVMHFSDIIALMLLQNGADFNNLSGDENAVSVFDTYTNFVLSANNFWNEQLGNSTQAFINERAAMIFAPTWQIGTIKQLNPDLALVVSQVPQIRGGARKNIASYWVEGVSRGSQHQREAWEFLKFMMQKESLIKLYEAQVKSGRLFGYPYPRVDMADLLSQNTYVGPLILDAPILDSFPMISYTYDNGLNDRLIAYLKDAINGILLNASTHEALQTLQQGFAQVYADYQFTP